MIPLRDVIQTRTFPFITILLIVANAVAFLFELSIPDPSMPGFLRTFAMVPADLAWPTVFTSMFLHSGWLHFLGNMLYLWIFGDNVEERLGHFVFLVFYLVCGVAAAMAHTFMNPASLVPTLGASGAIAGVMGAYFVLYPQSRIHTLIFFGFFYRIVEMPAVVLLGIWFVMQFLSGAASVGVKTVGVETGGVAFWAHVAGFAAGIVWVLIFRNRRVAWN
jgi:membrane associated rhomboid family serine protease